MALKHGIGDDAGEHVTPRRSGRKPRTIWCTSCQSFLDFSDDEDVYYYGEGPRPTPVHCLGRSQAFIAHQWRNRMHHGHRRHPNCPHCGADLGCDKCAGRWAEVICTACIAWASLDGFIQHGPFLNTPVMVARRGGSRARLLAEYPDSWQRAYRRALAEEPDVPGPLPPTVEGLL